MALLTFMTFTLFRGVFSDEIYSYGGPVVKIASVSSVAIATI